MLPLCPGAGGAVSRKGAGEDEYLSQPCVGGYEAPRSRAEGHGRIDGSGVDSVGFCEPSSRRGVGDDRHHGWCEGCQSGAEDQVGSGHLERRPTQRHEERRAAQSEESRRHGEPPADPVRDEAEGDGEKPGGQHERGIDQADLGRVSADGRGKKGEHRHPHV
jgi:hypothetical protein